VDAQRRDGDVVLTPQVKDRATGGQDLETGRGGEQVRHQRSGAADLLDRVRPGGLPTDDQDRAANRDDGPLLAPLPPEARSVRSFSQAYAEGRFWRGQPVCGCSISSARSWLSVRDSSRDTCI
jgi:hypothetical protein